MKTVQVALKGMVFPMRGEIPIILSFCARNDGMKAAPPMRYLPCFSSRSSLDATLRKMRVSYTGVRTIEDEQQFIQAVPREYKIIVDPAVQGDGTVSFLLAVGAN